MRAVLYWDIKARTSGSFSIVCSASASRRARSAASRRAGESVAEPASVSIFTGRPSTPASAACSLSHCDAARSISRWDSAKAEKGRTRWASIVREAAKQAHRAWVPGVAEVVSTSGIAARAAASRVLVLEPTGTVRLTAVEFDASDGRDVVLVVGPEGGIAPEELTALTDAGATVVALGDTVLRTSTAGPAALAVVSTLLGRW